MKKLIVFTGVHCPSCHSMVAKLRKHNIEFREISTDTVEGALIAAKHQVRSLPTLVAVGGSSLVGDPPINKIKEMIK